MKNSCSQPVIGIFVSFFLEEGKQRKGCERGRQQGERVSSAGY